VKRNIVCAALAAALALPSAASAQILGEVVRIIDGDTVSVRVQQHVLNLHLRQIDAPEIGQPYGKDALDALTELCDAKTATLDHLGVDSERRIVGEIECAGVDAEQEQVRRGLAWVRGSNSADPALQKLQDDARAEGRGLWSEAAPVPPWQWSAILNQ
jgi:endonuclease YncB( thermonuclease family)